MPNGYNLAMVLRDSSVKTLEGVSAAASNTSRLFMEDPNTVSPEGEGSMDDPSGNGTRIIDDGSRKVCLLLHGYAGPTTAQGANLGALGRAERKMAVLLSSISLPAKSVKALGPAIAKGIPGDEYTETVGMVVRGSCLVPIGPTGTDIPGMIYTRSKGWEHV
jgi:hypothetical protein